MSRAFRSPPANIWPRSPHFASAYALETAAGATLDKFNLDRPPGSSLIVGGDGAGGTEIAASYSAASASANAASITTGSARIFITDTAANFATNQPQINALIKEG